jgi:hypothetical protein
MSIERLKGSNMPKLDERIGDRQESDFCVDRSTKQWPSGRPVVPKQVLGIAGNIIDDGRVDIAIAKFSSDHLVDLALFNGSNLGKAAANRSTNRGAVTDFRTPLRAPFAVTERGVTGGPDIRLTDLAPLDLV